MDDRDAHIARQLLAQGLIPEATIRLLWSEAQRSGVRFSELLRQRRIGIDRPLPGQRFGRYEIIAELAHGGMGAVYRARLEGSELDVALKVILRTKGEGAVLERFELEARALAEVSHPNLVRIRDFGRVGEVPFIVLDLLEGPTLHEWAVEQRRIGGLVDPEVAGHIFAQIAEGLSALHARGLVHRDIKPANIVLCDGGARPVIIDFGLVRKTANAGASMASLAEGLTQSHEVLGTPAFLAPEQLHSSFGEVGPASDVWALGGALFDVLTGRPPYGDVSFIGLCKLMDESDPPLVSSVEPELPEWIVSVIAACLQRKAERRPSLEAVGEALRHEAVVEVARAETARVGWWRAGAATFALALGVAAWLAWPRAPSAPPELIWQPVARVTGRARLELEVEVTNLPPRIDPSAWSYEQRFALDPDPDPSAPPGLLTERDLGRPERLEERGVRLSLELKPGFNEVRWPARAVSGLNGQSVELLIYLDTLPPSCEATLTAADPFADVAALAATASEPVRWRILKGGEALYESEGEPSPTLTWELPLAFGETSVTVEATDAVGQAVALDRKLWRSDCYLVGQSPDPVEVAARFETLAEAAAAARDKLAALSPYDPAREAAQRARILLGPGRHAGNELIANGLELELVGLGARGAAALIPEGQLDVMFSVVRGRLELVNLRVEAAFGEGIDRAQADDPAVQSAMISVRQGILRLRGCIVEARIPDLIRAFGDRTQTPPEGEVYALIEALDTSFSGVRGTAISSISHCAVRLRDVRFTGCGRAVYCLGRSWLEAERVDVEDSLRCAFWLSEGSSGWLRDCQVSRAPSHGLKVDGGRCFVERLSIRDCATSFAAPLGEEPAPRTYHEALLVMGDARVLLRDISIERSQGMGLVVRDVAHVQVFGARILRPQGNALTIGFQPEEVSPTVELMGLVVERHPQSRWRSCALGQGLLRGPAPLLASLDILQSDKGRQEIGVVDPFEVPPTPELRFVAER